MAHPEWKDAIKQLQAFEPSDGMRAQFAKTVDDERVSVADGTFDHIGVEDGWADLVVVAQVEYSCVVRWGDGAEKRLA